MTRSPSKTLQRLAAMRGIQSRYRSADGRIRASSPEAVKKILEAMGGSETDPARVFEPVSVAWTGVKAWLAVTVPERSLRHPAALVLETESGERLAAAPDLSSLRRVGVHEIDGERSVTLKAALPWKTAPGYHRLSLEVDGVRGEGFLVSAPRKAYGPPQRGTSPQWGLFAPLYALPSGGPIPSGDYTQLERFARFVAECGGGVAATLPLYDTFLEEPFSPSPYSPATRLFPNEFYVDVAALPELATLGDGKNPLTNKENQIFLSQLKKEPLENYRTAMAAKRRVMEAILEACTGGPIEERLEAFAAEDPEVADYARFRAAMDRLGTGWSSWPARMRDGVLRPGDFEEKDYRYHLYAQLSARSQLAGAKKNANERGVMLYLDLPLGTHPDGFDAWRHRELFASGVSAGAPPDGFFPKGQDWGFRPLHPRAMLKDGLRHVRQIMGRAMAQCDILRIDHMMGFHRLFWVPEGLPPTEGAYVRYPEEALYAVLSLESHRHRTAMVGEDLGTVPAAVRRAMDKRGVRRMWVFQFEASPESPKPSKAVPDGALAALNTHDMPTFAAFWRDLDLEDRLDLGILPDDERRREEENRAAIKARIAEQLGVEADASESGARRAFEALLRDLKKSPAEFLVVSLEDLWGETAQQNWPGVTDARPSWRRKARLPLEAIRQDITAGAALDVLARRTNNEEPMTNGKKKTVKKSSTAPRTSGVILTEDDVYLFNEGAHFRLYDKLGAHLLEEGGESGARFSVWAPNARAVHVTGDFNGWNRDAAALSPQASSGIWSGFLPGVKRGDRYKYVIESQQKGYTVEKADPFALMAETPPKTASLVWDLDYDWHDGEWIADRGERQGLDAPMTIYEVHLGSWARPGEGDGEFLGYREMAPRLAEYVKETGFTHVELLPVMEHPFYGSWGYQTTGYFAPTSRYGTPQDFMALIDLLHREGIGVILDWVPSHFPADEHGLGYFDGTHLYEHSDPRQGFHPEWKSSIFNYGRNEVKSFLISSALFWLDKYHADGLRVDAVASMLYLDYSRKEGEWIPNRFGGRENLEAIDFLRRLNKEIYAAHPDVQTFAEESTAWPMVSRPTYLGGLGFGLKWDMGWMHDTLRYFQNDPIYRHYHQNELTFRQIYAFFENFVMPLSHDEVVYGKGSLIGKMPGDDWQRFANLRLLLSYLYSQPGKKLLFMGGEFGQWSEWNHDRSLDWGLLDYAPHQGVRRAVQRLNELYRTERALHELDSSHEGFRWIDCSDSAASVLLYERRAKDANEVVVAAFNFTPVPRHNYRVGVDHNGRWDEIFNGDAKEYGGSGVGNLGGVESAPVPFHGRPFSLVITLPPLAAVFFKPSRREGN